MHGWFRRWRQWIKKLTTSVSVYFICNNAIATVDNVLLSITAQTNKTNILARQHRHRHYRNPMILQIFRVDNIFVDWIWKWVIQCWSDVFNAVRAHSSIQMNLVKMFDIINKSLVCRLLLVACSSNSSPIYFAQFFIPIVMNGQCALIKILTWDINSD